MNIDTVFHKGNKNYPLVIFIHGMGMNLRIWSAPSDARILGGKYPLSILFGASVPANETSFHDLKKNGFPVLAWSQSRPSGLILSSVRELRALLKTYREFTGNGIVFVCHSRGGLIARKYIEEDPQPVMGLITLATPHHGTSMARWAVSISPLTAAVNTLLDGVRENDIDSAVKRVLSFFAGSGLRELLPESDFFVQLRDRKPEGAFYLSIGGTNPDLLRAIAPPLPKLMTALVPGKILPEEMREGLGDGLVTASSAEMPYGDKHRNFHVNHAEIILDRKVRDCIMKTILSNI